MRHPRLPGASIEVPDHGSSRAVMERRGWRPDDGPGHTPPPPTPGTGTRVADATSGTDDDPDE